MTLIPVLLAMVVAPIQDKTVYKDSHLGLQFEYPKTWKVRRDKLSAVFEFTVDGGQLATVQLYSAKYKDTAETWQLIQNEVNRSMKRTVVRQWQEEFLGVPMLLTKIAYSEGGRSMSAMTGLLYTSYEQKMNFRLTVTAEGAERAEAAWHDSLLTLRTITGDLPTPEDLSKPSVKPQPPKPTTVWKPANSVKKIERGSVNAKFKSGDTQFKMYLPKGWILDGTKLKHDGLTGSMEMSVAIGLPEEAGMKLLNAVRDSLTEFETVTVREDKQAYQSRAGTVVGQVYRIGKTKGQGLVVGNVVGAAEAIYWSINYHCSDPNGFKKDRALLNDLFDLLYAERE